MARLSYFLIAAGVIGIDRFLKWWVQVYMPLPHVIIPGFVRIYLVHNLGGAFGIFPRSGSLFILVPALVSAGIAVTLAVVHIHSRLLNLGLALVLGGALGNLIDRITLGYVVDFFEVRWFSVFNFADTCITVGTLLIVIAALIGGEQHGTAG